MPGNWADTPRWTGAAPTHRYLRAAATDHLTADDLAFLYDYGVRCVVDLRSHYEVETRPSRRSTFATSRTIRADAGSDEFAPAEERDLPRPASADGSTGTCCWTARPPFGQVLRIMAEHVQPCTLFHCTAGKRTARAGRHAAAVHRRGG